MHIAEIGIAAGAAVLLALTDKISLPEGTATGAGLVGTYVIVKLVLHNEMEKLDKKLEKYVTREAFDVYVSQHAKHNGGSK